MARQSLSAAHELPESVDTFPALVAWIASTHHPNEKHVTRRGEGSLYGIAIKVGCAPSLVYRWAAGNIRMPDNSHLQALADVYGIPYARVLECAVRSMTGRNVRVSERRGRARNLAGRASALVGTLAVGAGLFASVGTAHADPTGSDRGLGVTVRHEALCQNRRRRYPHLRVLTPLGALRTA